MNVRTVERIMAAYPISVIGTVTVHPHDCRRTYARRLYEAKMPTMVIQQNLGHKSSKITNGYIGTLNEHTHKPAAVYTFNLGKLKA